MRIVFITGTRADFGKIRPLLDKVEASKHELFIFVTGMHMMPMYGYTWYEVQVRGYENVFKFQNNTHRMDLTFARTVEGFSDHVNRIHPDMIVVHGDRLEPLAAAIVGAMNNVVICHIEGGEVSGTIDEHFRHAISKLSQIHCVSTEKAKSRLVQMGETDVHVIGSPDVDVILSDQLPTLEETLARYDIPFKDYAIFLYHPVTTEDFREEYKRLVSAVIDSHINTVFIYPNNDSGWEIIMEQSGRFDCAVPSMRFEHFLTLLKHAFFIIGNSSCGLIEAPYYGTPAINVGSRQQGRTDINSVINCDAGGIDEAIKRALTQKFELVKVYGGGDSADRFMEVIAAPRKIQKVFNAINC